MHHEHGVAEVKKTLNLKPLLSLTHAHSDPEISLSSCTAIQALEAALSARRAGKAAGMAKEPGAQAVAP